MTQNRRYAVTGNIGSGKSTFCEILRRRGFPVLSCDEISHELWREEGYRRELARLFPSCCERGEIDKANLTSLVFSDPAALAVLDAFSHPRIMERLLQRAEKFPVCFCEVPLLFEGGYRDLFDGAVVLTRSEKERLLSVGKRDGISPEEVKIRTHVQLSPEKLEGNFLVVPNDGTLKELEARTEETLKKLGLSS